jgi:hypothetical protein
MNQKIIVYVVILIQNKNKNFVIIVCNIYKLMLENKLNILIKEIIRFLFLPIRQNNQFIKKEYEFFHLILISLLLLFIYFYIRH